MQLLYTENRPVSYLADWPAVGDPNLVGYAYQGFGGFLSAGKAVGSLFRQDVPDGNQQLAGDGDDGLLPGFGLA